MRKNGFTLIELLAVIVILAIIALIATPIILGIINDARQESQERSVELYASAVRNAIASYQLTHPNAPTKFSDLDVQYDGEVECAKEELYADGSFYIAECTVNGTEVDYTYGTKQSETPDVEETPSTQVYKPQYYAYTEFSGTVGETAAPTNPSTEPPTGEIRYLGYDVIDGVVSAAYSCFTRNDVEYCLKSNDFDTSIDIIKNAFSDVVDTDRCYFDDNESYCYGDAGLYVQATSSGYVDTYNGSVTCDIDFGNFICRNP